MLPFSTAALPGPFSEFEVLLRMVLCSPHQGPARLCEFALELLALQLKPVLDWGQQGDGLVGSKTFVQRVVLDVEWEGYAGWRRQHRLSLKEYLISLHWTAVCDAVGQASEGVFLDVSFLWGGQEGAGLRAT